MSQSKRNSVLIVLSSLALLITVLLASPSASLKAKELNALNLTNEQTEQIFKQVNQEDQEQATVFVKTALKVTKEYKYVVDTEKALDVGYSIDQVKELKKFYENMPPDQVEFLEQGKDQKIIVKEEPVQSIVPALPFVVYIALQELLAILTALGLAAVAQQFLKEIYTAGINKACRKFSPGNSWIKSFCKANGYPTE